MLRIMTIWCWYWKCERDERWCFQGASSVRIRGCSFTRWHSGSDQQNGGGGDNTEVERIVRDSQTDWSVLYFHQTVLMFGLWQSLHVNSSNFIYLLPTLVNPKFRRSRTNTDFRMSFSTLVGPCIANVYPLKIQKIGRTAVFWKHLTKWSEVERSAFNQCPAFFGSLSSSDIFAHAWFLDGCDWQLMITKTAQISSFWTLLAHRIYLKRGEFCQWSNINVYSFHQVRINWWSPNQ